eukprot:gnl/TRDRNA2_/TRDRNA2_160039_c0_seq1.p1 gnl/TRDRNA2_/TRDRNA2_160039_c0~~gnl/TRDRNA2_/TRDRNA2_160039_c0_seq1.p1  ORF type:complete len:279 (-),score=39.96 gnl/TRDRNA2_/TRDRNA2_160039_c0_seq1:468-1196(-)
MVTARKQQPLNATSPTSGVEEPGNVLTCTSFDQWHIPEADNYQGLRIARSIDPLDWQSVADQLRQSGFDNNHEVIDVGTLDVLLHRKLEDAALAISCCLPPPLAKIVCKDAQDIAAATCKLLPSARRLIMGLQLIGTNICSRWHQDNIFCRSIVAYNCSGTEYTADSNVNFDEMLNSGKTERVIRDKSRIHSLDVGDILLMKGKKWSTIASGLVHKSPEVLYSDSGVVQSRIILKVEVQDLA